MISLYSISAVEPQNTTDLEYRYKPLLHAIIFIIEMVIVSRLIAKFNSYYADKPGMAVSSGRHRGLQQLTETGSPYYHDHQCCMSEPRPTMQYERMGTIGNSC